MDKIQTHWDPNTMVARSTYKLSNGEYLFATAECHPLDVDMVSEKVGCTIAEQRLLIKCLQYTKNRQLQPELNALKKFYNTINQSKYYNENDYSNQMLIRQIKRLEGDIAYIKNSISEAQQSLKQYIEDKDTFYKTVREHRKKNQQAENE